MSIWFAHAKFSWLDVLTKINGETKAVKQWRKGQAPSLQGFQHGSGDGVEVDNTLSATRLS